MQCSLGPLAGQLVIHNKLEADETQPPCRGWRNVCEKRVNEEACLYVCKCVSVELNESPHWSSGKVPDP